MALNPEIRAELVELVREVVTQELQQFCHDFGNDLERSLTVAFEPCLQLLKTIDRNQNIISDTNDVLVKAVNRCQEAIIAKQDDTADDWWKGDTDDTGD